MLFLDPQRQGAPLLLVEIHEGNFLFSRLMTSRASNRFNGIFRAEILARLKLIVHQKLIGAAEIDLLNCTYRICAAEIDLLNCVVQKFLEKKYLQQKSL